MSVEADANLIEAWSALHPAADGVHQVVSIERVQGAAATKDERGRPLIFCPAGGEPIHALALQSVRLTHGVVVRLQSNGPISEQRVSVVKCLAEDPSMYPLFLRCLAASLPKVELERTQKGVDTAVRQLVDLFAQLTGIGAPASGLWAELLMIASAKDPRSMLTAWHPVGKQRHDFILEGVRLEVKSTVGDQRAHQFGLEQLQTGEGVRLCIASVLLEATDAGTTLDALRLRCLAAAGLDDELRLKVDRLCVEYLGNGWSAGLGAAFDEQAAAASFRFFSGDVIPRPLAPPGVSGVRFVADCEGLEEASDIGAGFTH